MVNNILNIANVILALLSGIVVWKIYRIVRGQSVLLILAALAWAIVVRMLTIFTGIYTPPWQIGFWVLFLLGMYSLLVTIKKFVK